MRSHAAWRSLCVPRNARRPLETGLGGTYAKALPCSVALLFLQKKRSHAAWRSKCSASVRRPRAPVLVFPIYGASPFLSCCIFDALVLCFSILWRRPFHIVNFCFSAWALWCFNFQYAALPFFQFWVSPWGAFWVAGSGRARLMA